MLSDINFNYSGGVQVNYNNEYDCESSFCDDICRCGRIVDEYINSVNIDTISRLVYEKLFNDDTNLDRNNKLNEILYGLGKELDIYTINRVFRVYEIWKGENWDIIISGGYYGEEIESIKLKFDISNEITKKFFEILKLNTLKEKIDHLLILEYGKIHKGSIGFNYESSVIDIDKIEFESKKHYNKVLEKDLTFYNDRNYTGIRGIVKKQGDRYIVIDGYHRLSATKFPKVKVFVVI